jgi:hypothetical protein
MVKEMMKNEKGLWVKVKDTEKDDDHISLPSATGMGCGKGISVVYERQ